jgi:hypothetical protein
VRIEYVQPSRCREEFLECHKSNDIKKAEAKARSETVNLKYLVALPLLQLLSDVGNHAQTFRQCIGSLLPNGGIGLPDDVPALRVALNHPLHAGIHQLLSTNLPRERSG